MSKHFYRWLLEMQTESYLTLISKVNKTMYFLEDILLVQKKKSILLQKYFKDDLLTYG